MENPAYWVQRSSQIPHPVKFPESRAVFAQMPDPGIPFQTQTWQNFFPRFLQKILEIPLVLGFWIWRSRRECFKVETDLSRCLFFSVLPSCFSRVYSISGFRWVSTQHHGCPRSSFALFWDNHGLQTRTPQISSSLRSKSDSKFDFAVIRDAIGLKVWRHFFDQSKTIRDLFTRGFPRLAPAICISFEFWSVFWIICVFCNWFCFYRSCSSYENFNEILLWPLWLDDWYGSYSWMVVLKLQIR